MRRRGGSVVAFVLLVGLCGACGSDPDLARSAAVDAPRSCEWLTAGGGLERTHATACDEPDAVGAATLDRLEQVWFAETRAEVTGAPVVTRDSVYFGDWSGRIYALRRRDGKVRWTRDLPVHPMVYAGQATSSPTLTKVGGDEALVIGSGRTVWALRAADGTRVWSHELGKASDPKDPIEIEASPTVAGDLVVVPTDVHNDTSHRSGLVTLGLADGKVRWTWDPEAGKPSGGCGSIWGTPAVDLARRLVVVGTGSCFRQASWTHDTEAIVGIELDTGTRRWSYQPRGAVNNQDWDFAGAPNLFTIGDRPVVGLGSKDGWYYVVDRTDGELVWKQQAVKQGRSSDGFAFGGFIGATSVAVDERGRAVVVGGTAVGDCPCMHAYDAATGEPLWRNPEPGGTYAAAASSGGVVFSAGIDQTLRAFDLSTGKIRWQHTLESISASGPAIAGDFLAIGVGFREPGSPGSPSGGVEAFRVLAPGEAPPPTTTTTRPDGPAVTALRPSSQPCVGTPCAIDFTLKDPPTGRKPSMTLEITPDPLRIRVETEDLGPPEAWLQGDDAVKADGATVYALFVTPRDDKPGLGSVICVLGDDGSCEGDRIALAAERYTRISLLALVDADTPPTLQEGYARLVTTHSFDPALVPAP